MTCAPSVALLLALLLPASVTAQSRSAASSAPPPSAAITGALAERVPSDVNFYMELAGATSDAERTAVAEMYSNLMASLGGLMGGPTAITLDEFQMLAASNIALSFRMPVPQQSTSSTGWLAIVRTPSAANASTLVKRLVDLVVPMKTGAKAPRKVVVHGRTVVPLIGSTAADSPHYALAGNSILVGDMASIERALDDPISESSLASTELYRDGRARVGNDAGLFTLMKLPKELFGKPGVSTAEVNFASLVGYPSLRGVVSGSDPWSPGAPGVTVISIERDASNLLTILAGGPALTLRPAQLLPADTGLVAAFALDLPAIEALLRPSKVAKDTGIDVAELERVLGMSLRDQLLPALGSEVTVGLRFEMPPASMTMDANGAGQSSSPAPEVRTIVLIDVKQPDLVRSAFERALTATSMLELAVRDVGGVRLASSGRYAVAVVDGVAMVGEPAEVERVLLARAAEQTLGASHELDGSVRRLDGDTLALVHPTPALRDLLGSLASTMGVVLNASMMGFTSLEDTVVRREPLGIVVTATGGSAFSVAALGVVAAIAIPSLLRARGAANEAAAIGTLRSLASAQATFQAKRGRFGTMAELVAEDMINPELRDGVERNGYVFREVRPTAKTFEFSAAPVDTTAGDSGYNIIEDFVIRFSPTKTPPRRKAGKPLGGS